MNFKSKMVGVFGAAIMTFVMVGGASAQNASADVSVQVNAPQGATLAATISSGTFNQVDYKIGSGSTDSNGSLTITATDTRGVGSGWTVTLGANGDFKDGNKSFAVSNMSLKGGSIQGLSNADGNGMSAPALGNVSNSAQNVLVAPQGKGVGVFTDTINSTIKVPDGTLVGNYKTTLTVSITAGN